MKNKKGFTLIELLLVVAIISIIAGIVILAINPTRQLRDSNDARRRADVNTILNAVYQFSVDNRGDIPNTIFSTTTQICQTGVSLATCQAAGFTSLFVLTDSERYLTSIPVDPAATTTNGTGYYIEKTVNNRIRVSAPASATTTGAIVISATR